MTANNKRINIYKNVWILNIYIKNKINMCQRNKVKIFAWIYENIFHIVLFFNISSIGLRKVNNKDDKPKEAIK